MFERPITITTLGKYGRERKRETLTSTSPAPASHGYQQKMKGRREVALVLSIAGCESVDTFNGFQFAQAEEANYKTWRNLKSTSLCAEMKPRRER